ncbi:MAG: enoyl-CoA hydratase/isomerase family protein [Candidatus Abyssobacteria bacterium SURF_5]|uniref:Enoyl-CoA hydratase/isomerase family protein n=1 Tax=Abyssobacteria bacterium (strain SURF_5) TaxID=2093360 RepID=A0A3A4P007_ABYX5|nr:MAG: enoyl-CoA hydratase/isomerase family protein [Candidatus Abyssubacteria bacterium SURF_5]
MAYEHLMVEKSGHVAVVTLNRLDKLNALSIDLMKELQNVVGEFQEDIETRVVIFTGAGKHFSAGRDLQDQRTKLPGQAGILERQRQFHLGPRLIQRLVEMNQITIAAINGGALGGAACIVSALDFRIGADDCFVAYPEVGLGIPLSWVSLPLCVRLIGPARTKRFVILARREKAQTLLDWGFLDEVVPKRDLMKRVGEIAEEYAAMPPIAAQMVKRSVNAISSAIDAAIMHMDSDQVLLSQMTQDFNEGVAAFLEKRKPTFKGE